MLGWGPLTHYVFACQQAGEFSAPAQCIGDEASQSLVLGADFPDALFFGSFVSSYGGPPECSGVEAMHSLDFATDLVRAAPSWDSGNSTFNATQFSMGFASHVLADSVGFYPDPEAVLFPKGSFLNWLSTWNYMLTIDAALAFTVGLTMKGVPSVPLPDSGANFVSATWNALQPKGSPTIPAALISTCGEAWREALDALTLQSLEMTQNTWDQQLVEFGKFGDTTGKDAWQNLNPAFVCIDLVWVQYGLELFDPDATAAVITANMNTYTAGLFESGKCTPSAASPSTAKSAATTIKLTESLKMSVSSALRAVRYLARK